MFIVDKAISIVAKRNSGKSYLLRYLVKKQAHKFNKVFVICPTDSINSFYSTITDKSCIFDEFNENTRFISYSTITEKSHIKEEKRQIRENRMEEMRQKELNKKIKQYIHEVDIFF